MSGLGRDQPGFSWPELADSMTHTEAEIIAGRGDE